MSNETKTNSLGQRQCKCGCQATVAGKAKYRPGHDARHISQLMVNVRVELNHLGQAVKATDEGLAALDSPALKHKFLAAVERAEAKATAKKPADRKPKQDATPEPIATIRGEEVDPMWAETPQADKGEVAWDEPIIHGEVKVGRWTYPSRTVGDTTRRNTKRDGSGEWIKHEG